MSAILTRADGTPFVKPDPADYVSAVDFVRAYHAYRDAIADEANRAFDAGFRIALAKEAR